MTLGQAEPFIAQLTILRASNVCVPDVAKTNLSKRILKLWPAKRLARVASRLRSLISFIKLKARLMNEEKNEQFFIFRLKRP